MTDPTKAEVQKYHHPYDPYSDDAKEICERMDWDFDVGPIKTMRRNGIVYMTGTALKPDEWRRLKSRHPHKMNDGTPIKLVNIPTL